MMVWKGRLSGPTWLGWPCVSTKPAPRFCKLMPPGATMPDPKPMKLDWMKLTIMPFSSAVVR